VDSLSLAHGRTRPGADFLCVHDQHWVSIRLFYPHLAQSSGTDRKAAMENACGPPHMINPTLFWMFPFWSSN
jgi:hypothetical protein